MKILVFYLLRFPSTTLHELLHASMVLLFIVENYLMIILARIVGIHQSNSLTLDKISLIPNRAENRLGYVAYSGATSWQSALIAIAPLLAWLLLTWMIFYETNLASSSPITLLFPSVSPLMHLLIVIIITPHLLWAGRPSMADITLFISGITSLRSLAYLIGIIASYLAYPFANEYVSSVSVSDLMLLL